MPETSQPLLYTLFGKTKDHAYILTKAQNIYLKILLKEQNTVIGPEFELESGYLLRLTIDAALPERKL